MTRGRQSDEEITRREGVEGTLSVLGNARVYTRLVRDRVAAAMLVRDTNVLQVAIQDLDQLEQLIKRAQARITEQDG